MSKLTEYDEGFEEGFWASKDYYEEEINTLRSRVGLLEARLRVYKQFEEDEKQQSVSPST